MTVRADVIGMTATKTAPFIVLATFAAAIVSIVVMSPGEGSAPPAKPVAAVVTTTEAPATTVPPVTTTSTVKPAQVARIAHRATERPAEPTSSTVPVEMPEELKELQKRIPDAETEMSPDDHEHLPQTDSLEEATDWVE